MIEKMSFEDLRPEFRKPYSKVPFLSLNKWWALHLMRLALGLGFRPQKDPDVTRTTIKLAQFEIRLYQPVGHASGAGMVWIHGGGMVVGKAKMNDATCNAYVKEIGMVVASVEYRVAPEAPYPAAIDDCFATWLWLLDHAAELGIDPTRIAIAGASAGGGLSAALAQRVFDTGGQQPAAQILFYPMLDDRTAARDELTSIEHIGWTNSNNFFGWSSYLGHDAGSAAETPPWAVPGRREDVTGLAPAWIGVGDKDLFFEENCAYAERLKRAGIDCHIERVEGGPHGFDSLVPAAQTSKDFIASSNQFLAKHLGLKPVPTGD